jgi:hypothetical protein
MANYFVALLNFFCSIALVLRKPDFLTTSKVSSPNSALELDLGPQISLSAHQSLTGNNQTLLRAPHKLIHINRTKLTQIILVQTNYPSSNRSKSNNLPPDKIRAQLNGGNSSFEHLKNDFCPRTRSSRPSHQFFDTGTKYNESDSLQRYDYVVNKNI